MLKVLCKNQLKKIMFVALLAVGMLTVTILNSSIVLEAASNEESQGIVMPLGDEIEGRCIPSDGSQVFRVTTTTFLYSNSTGNASSAYLLAGTHVTHHPGSVVTNGRRYVSLSASSGSARVWGWVDNNHIVLVTC